jgi:16S rRNA A1518/A1519 N6-dimethyltransferase RsmA/KsgA/DIM1 with predicted DNA glycosylase/AP lyase activity
VLQYIEVNNQAVELLEEKHPSLTVHHQDVLQVHYPDLASRNNESLVVVGNLPYYITSQILFALCDASHVGAVDSATVTMQWEVAQRMVAPTRCKDYGILSVVFQLYAGVKLHFKIPPTVFYPQPKVDSALVGLHFLGPDKLRARLAGVDPAHFRRIVTTAFQQRRKTIRNSLKHLSKELHGDNARVLWESTVLPLPDCVEEARANEDAFAQTQQLPIDWATKRPEELTPGQFVELTRLLFGPREGVLDESIPLGSKVWRKLKHGKNT